MTSILQIPGRKKSRGSHLALKAKSGKFQQVIANRCVSKIKYSKLILIFCYMFQILYHSIKLLILRDFTQDELFFCRSLAKLQDYDESVFIQIFLQPLFIFAAVHNEN